MRGVGSTRPDFLRNSGVAAYLTPCSRLPRAMPTHQHVPSRATSQADIFSLGATILELLEEWSTENLEEISPAPVEVHGITFSNEGFVCECMGINFVSVCECMEMLIRVFSCL